MYIVTSGFRYLDIDAYAGCVAYAELLRLQGHEAQAVCEAPWNESISASVRKWNVEFKTHYTPSPEDRFVLIDISEPDYFERFVTSDNVAEVIDHHPGFEAYWEQRIGTRACIEFIGAACTLVYEKWKAAGLANKMSVASARLLISGILDNTLNFGAQVTTDRDKVAYQELLAHAELPDDWTARYFTECEAAILANVGSALATDTKTMTFASLPGTFGVGQLVVWDAAKVLERYRDEIARTLAKIASTWFLNVVDVGGRRSYFVCEDVEIQAWLSMLLHVKFRGSVAEADRLWLRKEIIKADIEISSHGSAIAG